MGHLSTASFVEPEIRASPEGIRGAEAALVKPPRVSIINGLCVPDDAISNSIADEVRLLSDGDGETRYRPKVYAYVVRHDLATSGRVVGLATQILLDPHFQQSELVIFHFGIFYPLFDLAVLASCFPRVLGRYHNVTPAEYLPAEQRGLIEKSLAQSWNLDFCDRIAADSDFSRGDLKSRGFAPEKLTTLTLSAQVAQPSREAIAKKALNSDHLHALFVGRFVKSKGVLDLLQAARCVEERFPGLLKLTLAGNVVYSDEAYIEEVRAYIARHFGNGQVRFEGAVSPARLQQLYLEAELFILPSYHEGFGVPVVEAFRSGCYVIAYSSGNLTELVDQRGILVRTGDVDDLAAKVTEIASRFQASRLHARPFLVSYLGNDIPYADYVAQIVDHSQYYDFARFRERFWTVIRETLATPRLPRSVAL